MLSVLPSSVREQVGHASYAEMRPQAGSTLNAAGDTRSWLFVQSPASVFSKKCGNSRGIDAAIVTVLPKFLEFFASARPSLAPQCRNEP